MLLLALHSLHNLLGIPYLFLLRLRLSISARMHLHLRPQNISSLIRGIALS